MEWGFGVGVVTRTEGVFGASLQFEIKTVACGVFAPARWNTTKLFAVHVGEKVLREATQTFHARFSSRLEKEGEHDSSVYKKGRRLEITFPNVLPQCNCVLTLNRREA